MAQAQLGGVGPQHVLQVQCRVAGPPRVILVRDGRSEQCHDAVAGELVDVTLEPLDAFRQDREETLHDRRPLFRIEPPGQAHPSSMQSAYAARASKLS